jgi:hypothetical protein
VRFQGFHDYLRDPQSSLGRSALRNLHRVFDDLHHGIDPEIVSEARLGEALELVWDYRQDRVDPLLARLSAEVIRFLRRCHINHCSEYDEAAPWQISRMQALENSLEDYLKHAPCLMTRCLSQTAVKDHPDFLLALDDLRAEAADVLLSLLADENYPYAGLAIDVLRWSTDPRVAPWLRHCAVRLASKKQKTQWTKQAASAPEVADSCYPSVLRALRHHPSSDTERLLIAAARDSDPERRAAAIGSLGWSEPFDPDAIAAMLGRHRDHPDGDVRHATRAALARLGDRESLQNFRAGLCGDEPLQLCRCIDDIGNEGLLFLWPDLDGLTDSNDPDVSQMAWDAIERLGEMVSGR